MDLIDDMEDGDGTVLLTNGRSGPWLSATDGTEGSSITPSAVGAWGAGSMSKILVPNAALPKSLYAAHITGGVFTGWGGVVTTNLANGAVYDASSAKGITFWARTDAAGGQKGYRAKILDKGTWPDGGVCGNACYDGFGVDFEVTGTWKKFEVTWAQMTQAGTGLVIPTGPQPDWLYLIQFTLPAATSVDLWIDDVGFLK